MPPSFIKPLSEGVVWGHGAAHCMSDEEAQKLTQEAWYGCITIIEEIYKKLISFGVAPQIARSVFPNALASRIITTGNLRVWRHVFCMRTCKEAHPQMRQVIIPLLEEFQAKIPIIYADIIPNSRQIDNMRLPQ